jgi:hypothetical protein
MVAGGTSKKTDRASLLENDEVLHPIINAHVTLQIQELRSGEKCIVPFLRLQLLMRSTGAKNS